MQVEAIDFKLSVEQNLHDIELDARAAHMQKSEIKWKRRLSTFPQELKMIADMINEKNYAKAYEEIIILKGDMYSIINNIQSGRNVLWRGK